MAQALLKVNTGIVAAFIAACGLLVSCGGEQVTDGSASRSATLLHGAETFEYPAVGWLHLPGDNCTATLVTPNVALTAAHCVGYVGLNVPLGNITFLPSSGSKFSAPVIGALTPYDYSNIDDIAVLNLSWNIPATDPAYGSDVKITPMSVATSDPASGTPLSMIGFGCTDTFNQSGAGTKRISNTTWGAATHELCPGDSGGPLFDPASLSIVGVAARPYDKNLDPNDGFADVPASSPVINDWISFWSKPIDCRALSQSQCTSPAYARSCAWYDCSETCFSRGTPNQFACCGQNNRNQTACETMGNCTWYPTSQQCWPTTTIPELANDTTQCRAFSGDPNACVRVGCRYTCGTCWPSETSDAIACGGTS